MQMLANVHPIPASPLGWKWRHTHNWVQFRVCGYPKTTSLETSSVHLVNAGGFIVCAATHPDHLLSSSQSDSDWSLSPSPNPPGSINTSLLSLICS